MAIFTDSDSDFEAPATPVAKRPSSGRSKKKTVVEETEWDLGSDEEVQGFDGEDDGSDFEMEEAVKPKKAAPKKASAPKKQTTLKTTTAARKPSKAKTTEPEEQLPLQPVEDPNLIESENGTPKRAKNASSQYQKLSQLEHILKRPDTYIGSIERTESNLWVFDSETKSMVHKTVSIVPGLYKIFDEILVNAADNKTRDPSMNLLEVTINPEENTISVMNNGKGIPIEIHEKEKIYIPELIFGNLLTSSNYDDDQKKVTGGRNGFGAKVNIPTLALTSNLLTEVFSYVIFFLHSLRLKRLIRVVKRSINRRGMIVCLKCQNPKSQ